MNFERMSRGAIFVSPERTAKFSSRNFEGSIFCLNPLWARSPSLQRRSGELAFFHCCHIGIIYSCLTRGVGPPSQNRDLSYFWEITAYQLGEKKSLHLCVGTLTCLENIPALSTAEYFPCLPGRSFVGLATVAGRISCKAR